jgi:RNA polymerase primary sigma factor
MYLREIGKYPLLNAQQERDLAKRIVEGDDEARNLLGTRQPPLGCFDC